MDVKVADSQSDGERDGATILVCHLAGNVRFETISDLE
jgi:hypothetical protein